MATLKGQKKYYYQPPPTPTNDPSSPTFVLDKQALELPTQAQATLRSRGYFLSVTGALFTHSDPRIAPSPVWIRLLSPTCSLVYVTQLVYLLLRLRLNFFPCFLVLFMALDTTLQQCINLDGEHCSNLSTLASLLLFCCLTSDHLSFVLASLDTSTTSENMVLASPASSWTAHAFPMASWSKLIVWPVGATFCLFFLHILFVRCTSFAWIAGWTFIGVVVILSVLWSSGDQVEVYGTLAVAAVLSAAMVSS